jgi:AraC-like DNA-binding protein
MSCHRTRQARRVMLPAYSVTIVLEGLGHSRYRGTSHLLAPERVILGEPEESYVVDKVDAPGSSETLLIEPELLRSTAAELGFGGTPHWREYIAPAKPPVFRSLFGLHAAVRKGCGSLELQSRWTSALAMVLRHYGHSEARGTDPRPERTLLEPVRELLHDRLEDNVPLDELARAARLNRFQVLRAFVRTFGMPPHAYQISLRICRSMKLLRSRVPAALVAASLGFVDQSHFSRHFKAIVGVTPGEYARG